MWAIGIPKINAACAAPRISYLSPNTTTTSGLSFAKASASCDVARPAAFATPRAESSLSARSTNALATNPSCSMNLSVDPCCADKCAPVTTSWKSISESCFSKDIRGASSPYSALVPVTTQIFRLEVMILSLRYSVHLSESQQEVVQQAILREVIAHTSEVDEADSMLVDISNRAILRP